MPRGAMIGRGAKKNYKGKRRVFTSAEEIQRQNEEEKIKKEWRETKGSDVEEEEGAKGDADSSDSSSEEEDTGKNKGVAHLIEIQNPNRAMNKTKKAKDIDQEHKTTLSRREREEIEKQQAQVRYQEMHMQGKTQEAMSDLARLSIIRKQREEAAKKREEDKKAKEAAADAAATKKGKS